jgi:hypothetical protein
MFQTEVSFILILYIAVFIGAVIMLFTTTLIMLPIHYMRNLQFEKLLALSTFNFFEYYCFIVGVCIFFFFLYVYSRLFAYYENLYNNLNNAIVAKKINNMLSENRFICWQASGLVPLSRKFKPLYVTGQYSAKFKNFYMPLFMHYGPEAETYINNLIFILGFL